MEKVGKRKLLILTFLTTFQHDQTFKTENSRSNDVRRWVSSLQLEAKALQDTAREVCSYAKKRTRQLGSKGSGKFSHWATSPGTLPGRATHSKSSTGASKGAGQAEAGKSAFFSFSLSEVECFSALLSCYSEDIYLLYLVMYSSFLRMVSKHASIFWAETLFTYAKRFRMLDES